MAKDDQGTIEIIGYGLFQPEQKFGEGIKVKRHPQKRFWERWATEIYGKWKAPMGKSIAGDSMQRGPDILKFIKKLDPDNSAGSLKDALDIMQKLQDNSTKKKDLYSSIKPLQEILGGNLYGKMISAGAGVAASAKVQQKEEPSEDIIAQLIAAALAMCTPEDQVIVSNLLDETEIKLIRTAYYGNGVYASAQSTMPVDFINAINHLIPIFKAQKGA